jgi:hypothetical protein
MNCAGVTVFVTVTTATSPASGRGAECREDKLDEKEILGELVAGIWPLVPISSASARER